ncbi:baculoviral IAP repeat-containing protein 3-like [Physella acuta]|uniref:baculoviral IAP repeat-containing protein 3-like n=1 Tax=Physella acuta TaxID=109671 RepID=UPI0027DB7A0B|nr:baculoviral IAP repeat-containing protein 3-like [Physella acuta]
MQQLVQFNPPREILGIPWDSFKEEIFRIATFKNFPKSCSTFVFLLAENGFVYTGTGENDDDKVTCYFCLFSKNRWNILDSVEDIHKLFSPACPMVTGERSINVSFVTTETFETIARKLFRQSEFGLSDTENNLIQATVSETSQSSNRDSVASVSPLDPQRSGNLIAPPAGSAQTSSLHQESSFSSTTSPVIVTSVTLQHIPQQQIPEQHIPQHNTANPTQNPTSDLPNQSTEVSTSSPLQTSAHTIPSPNPTDPRPPTQTTPSTNPTDPRASSRGPTYAELGIITERPKRMEYAQKIKRLETYSGWPRGHHLQPLELAEAGFYFAGYGDCARCFFCGGGLRNWEDEDNVLVEHARWFPKCAFIRQQMGQVFVDAVQTLNADHDLISLEMVYQKIRSSGQMLYLESQENPLQRDPAVKTVTELGFSLQDVLQIAGMIKQEGNLISSADILIKLKAEGKRKLVNSSVEPSISDFRSRNTPEMLENINRMKEQNNQLRQQTVCKICMDKEVAVVFLPCGHLVSCGDCAVAMRDCPICRVNVKGIVRAFMS